MRPLKRFIKELNKRPRYYVLKNKKPVPVKDVLTWGKMFENFPERRVDETCIGKIRVSTVFLGLDHSFHKGPPILFETMIFGGMWDDNEYQERYSTWAQAQAGHDRAVALVAKHIKCKKKK